jgi:hypothetical protein
MNSIGNETGSSGYEKFILNLRKSPTQVIIIKVKRHQSMTVDMCRGAIKGN